MTRSLSRWSWLCALGLAVWPAVATEPCLPGFDTPLAETYRSAGGDLHVAAAGIGTEDGARQIVIDVPGTPVAAWIYWLGEIRIDGEPDPSITIDGGALAAPLDLYGTEVGRRHQVFSDERAGGCAGDGGEVVMRADLPLDAFAPGSNSFIISNFDERTVVCNGQQRGLYRRGYGIEIVVVYRGSATCAAGGGDDDSSDDDRSSDDRSEDRDHHDHGKHGKHGRHGKHHDDDGSGDDDSSDDGGHGHRHGSGPCEREVILLDGADVASLYSFSREPGCGPQADSEVVCFTFDPLACDSTGELTFGVGGTVARQTPTPTRIHIASEEQTWLETGSEPEPASLIGSAQVIEVDQLIDSNFYYAGRKLSVFSRTIGLNRGTTHVCFQIDLLPVQTGEQPQHVTLFDASLALDRTCGGAPAGPPCDCGDDHSSDDGHHGDHGRDDDDSSDDGSDDCSCDEG